MQPDIYAGMTLYLKNGDKVAIASVSDGAMTVESGNRRYARSFDAIGKSLFTSNPLEQAAAEEYEGDEAFRQESQHLKTTQEQLGTFDGFVLAIEVGLFGNVLGTRIGFDEVTKEELIRSPYFARMDIDVGDQDDKALEIAYIGKKGVYHEDRLLISDWRSEIGQKYYMKNITRFEYNGFDYELLLRRALRIRNGVLSGYQNEFAKAAYFRALSPEGPGAVIEDEKITDPFLQDIIRQKHTQNKLTDIIESIQENQNAIITCDETDNIVVQGCAGSGKTMILLHRLSFIKYRRRDLDLGKIKILTPNSLFSMYINDLSTSLELEKIDRLTVNEYYAELLSRYYNIERTQLARKCTPGELLDFKTSLLYKEKAGRGRPDIYSDSLWDFIGNETAAVLRDFFESRLNIGRLRALLGKYQKYGAAAAASDIRVIAGLKLALGELKKTFEPYYKQLEACIESETALSAAELEFARLRAVLPNADALLDRLVTETASKESSLRLSYEQRSAALSGELGQRKTELRKTPPESPKRRQLVRRLVALTGELAECDFCLAALKYERLRHVCEIDKRQLAEESGRLALSDEDMILIENAYKDAAGFSVGMIEKAVLDAVKRAYGSSLGFRDTLYTALLTRYFVHGPLAGSESLLCVDEAHDLYANEYRLFAAIAGNALRFNIYGDINQIAVEGEGIGSWDSLKSVFDFTRFTLNENYRNSSEIIEYCNGTLGFSTSNLGVSGEPVQTLDFDGFIRHLNDNIPGTRKLAVIVKKKTAALLGQLRDRLAVQINPGGVNTGEIALLTPEESKGLEFDTCYVLVKGMNRNEKYISCTRALNELYIVS